MALWTSSSPSATLAALSVRPHNHLPANVAKLRGVLMMVLSREGGVFVRSDFLLARRTTVDSRERHLVTRFVRRAPVGESRIALHDYFLIYHAILLPPLLPGRSREPEVAPQLVVAFLRHTFTNKPVAG